MRVSVALLVVCAQSAFAQSANEWAHYGRDAGGARYSPLTQIDRTNVTRLIPAWTYHTGEIPEGRNRSFEATPLVIDGVMFLVTPLGKIIALDPATGLQRWIHDARVNAEIRFGDFTSRGVSSWVDRVREREDACYHRIFAGTVDARLIALDAATGKPCADFGDSGTVNLRKGLRNIPSELAEYEVTSPPAIVGDLVITGS